MNSDQVADIKQFIAATIHQSTAHLQEELVRIEGKVEVLAKDVADALHTSNEATGAQLKDHE